MHLTEGIRKIGALLGGCALIALVAAQGVRPADAETLKQALSSAYRSNPSLEAERSRLRAQDETVAIANSGYRPRVAAGGSLSWEHSVIDPSTAGNTIIIGPGGGLGPGGIITEPGVNRHARYGVAVTQPVFSGFQTTNQVRIAESGVRARRELLRDTERTVFMQVVAAYSNIIATRKVLRLREKNLSIMERQVKAAQQRLAYNELTRTDVAQATLRMGTAQSLVVAARAAVKTALSNYLTVVGNEPSDLSEPALARALPRNLNEAQAIAARENPVVLNALYSEEAARHGVDLARGRLLPTVNLSASWNEDDNFDRDTKSRSTAVVVSITVPLYESGEAHAAVRQAKQLHLSQIQQIELARGQVQLLVASAWAEFEASRIRLGIAKEQTKSSLAALEGVRREEGLGQRTLLDILNAEQEHLEALTLVVTMQRDYLVASYQVLAQIGQLDASILDLGPVYDPTIHFGDVHRKWFGLTISYPDGRSELVDVKDTRAVPKTNEWAPQ